VITIVRSAMGHREHAVMLAVPAIYLVIAHVTLSYPGPGDISLQLANRGLAYAGVIALLPLAALVSIGVKRLSALSGDQGTSILLAAVVLVTAVVITVGHSKEHLAGQLSKPTRALQDAAVELRTLVPQGARFSMTRDYPAEIDRVGVIEPEHWLAWASGVDILNAFNPESSNAGAIAYTADSPDKGQKIDDWIRKLRRLGVSDVVVDKADIDNQMRGSALVDKVWSEGPITIYGVLSDSGGTPPILIDTGQTGAAVSFSQRGAERLEWTIKSGQQFTSTLALGWSPKWHGTIDGAPIRITKTDEGLMSVVVPSGVHTLALAYRPDTADHVGLFLTLGTLWFLFGLPLWRRRRKRRDNKPDSDAGAVRGPETLGAWRERVLGPRSPSHSASMPSSRLRNMMRSSGSTGGSICP
jgi:hypothetical protein